MSILGLLKRKEWPQCRRKSSWQVRRSRSCQKEKEQSRLSKVPDRKVGESQGEREPHLGERGESEREHEEERVDSTVKEGRFQGGEGGQARRASLGEVEGSMSGCVDAKALHEDLQSLSFTLNLAKPKIGKGVGRRRARS